MARKMFITSVLVAFALFQYGCKTSEATQEITDNDQIQVAVEDAQQSVDESSVGAANMVVATSEISAAVPAETPASDEEFTGIRVNCGQYYGEYTDNAGNVWLADQDKTADNTWGAVYGSAIERPDLGIEGTDCPIIYESEHYSMDAYEFGVPAGKYDVILHFAETYEGIMGAGERVFGVSINGETVLEDFDPYVAAGEFNTPAVKKFAAIEPVDGKITIGFEYGLENPQINGIEILPAGSAASPAAGGEAIAIRVNCGTEDGTEAYTDEEGNVWQPDRLMDEGLDWGAMDGEIISRPDLEIKGTKAPGIYQSETYSMSAYQFKVPAGKYTVKLHFAETYDGIYGEGERVFGVSINEETVLEDMDPMKEAGEFATAVVKEFKGIEPVDGTITIGFEYGMENPQINGIEILSEGAAKAPATSAAGGETFAIRVNCGTEDGTEAYTDEEGNVWQPDRLMDEGLDWGAMDGEIISRPTLEIKGTKAPVIYQSESYSMSAYTFKVPADGKYTVKLHFAETYDGIYGEGERVFGVSINGETVIEDMDPFKAAGEFAKAVVKEFKGVEPVNDTITIGFVPSMENPQINGIEVIAE